ncbi:MAG: hypothetical protein KF819_18995 [Labilithrix sp.]|nr:hypothetical protein [Labilithrix sp.]
MLRARRLLIVVCALATAGCSWLLGISEDPVFDPTLPLPDAAEAGPEATSDVAPPNDAELDAGDEEDAAEEPIDPEDTGVPE